MRAILTALLLTIATQAGAECGKLCDLYWWTMATEAGPQTAEGERIAVAQWSTDGGLRRL